MGIEVELNGKGGRVCPQGQSGAIRCPLIVRSTSEDVLTGEVFGLLKHIRPHLWLTPLLNLGLDVECHRQVWFKGLSIRLWERQDRFPPELLGFREGRTEPDIVIEFQNPPTTIWIEAKYTSPLAERTSNSDDNDQVLRGIRTLLAATGHVTAEKLFAAPKRKPIWLALLAYKPDSLVDRYRNPKHLAECLKGMVDEKALPTDPFVGTVTWNDIARILSERMPQMTPAERSMTQSLAEYIRHKMELPKQVGLPVLPNPTDHTLSHPLRILSA
jgi:hypothetical protein